MSYHVKGSRQGGEEGGGGEGREGEGREGDPSHNASSIPLAHTHTHTHTPTTPVEGPLPPGGQRFGGSREVRPVFKN